jgi:hypothetical protein
MISCNTKESKEKTVDKDAVINSAEGDTAAVKKDSHYFWASDFDKKGMVMTKVRPLPDDSLTTTAIIQLMNDQYPEIQVKFDKISNDTVFVNIPDSKYLTQETGSSGPEIYFAELTYNLTEIKNLNYVAVKFKKGDHASPGIFTRTDFVNIK